LVSFIEKSGNFKIFKTSKGLKMSITKPIPYTKFNFDQLTIPPVTKRDGGGLLAKPIYTYDNGATGELQLQLRVAKTPFGFSSFPDKRDPTKSTESMSINYDVPSDFYTWSNEYLEENLVKYVHANSKALFGKVHTLDIVRALSNGIVRTPQDPEKAKNNPPTFKVAIREKTHKVDDKRVSYEPKQFWAACVDKKGMPMDITKVSRNSVVRLIVKLSNFYVISGKFSFSWDLVKCEVIQPGENAYIETDPDMYPDEACYKPIDELYDEDMEHAIQEMEQNATKRPREAEEEKNGVKPEEEGEVDTPSEKKKVKKSTKSKK